MEKNRTQFFIRSTYLLPPVNVKDNLRFLQQPLDSFSLSQPYLACYVIISKQVKDWLGVYLQVVSSTLFLDCFAISIRISHGRKIMSRFTFSIVLRVILKSVTANSLSYPFVNCDSRRSFIQTISWCPKGAFRLIVVDCPSVDKYTYVCS